MRDYTPRRCGKRWLDGDCPTGVLAIVDHGAKELERFDVVYTETFTDGRDTWMNLFCLNERGSGYHTEMKAHEVAAYRYRMKHRYARWSDLPAAVQQAVRLDLATAEMEDSK